MRCQVYSYAYQYIRTVTHLFEDRNPQQKTCQRNRWECEIGSQESTCKSRCAGLESKASDTLQNLQVFFYLFYLDMVGYTQGNAEGLMVQCLGLETECINWPPAPDIGRRFELKPITWEIERKDIEKYCLYLKKMLWYISHNKWNIFKEITGGESKTQEITNK